MKITKLMKIDPHAMNLMANILFPGGNTICGVIFNMNFNYYTNFIVQFYINSDLFLLLIFLKYCEAF